MSTGETLATRESGSGASTNGTPLLSLRAVSKTFGPVRALSGVDLDIAPAKVTALAGDNGAGKSVTIKTISGLWPPDEGEILWDGKPVHLHGPKDAEALGIRTIYQDLALCDNLDIVQNMFLGHEKLRRRLLDEDDMEIAARKTLEELHVRTIRSIRMPVASLSGGQRQSVAVAKAVLFDAQMVIMDEPTAALGVSQTRQVLDLIKRLASQGVAVLLVSHNLNDVFEVADRIAVLYLGRLVAEDEASKFDPQVVVEYMTTGQSSRGPHASAPGPAPQGQAPERKES
jgi:ABC-type sugar transport system ATPase subunit